MQMPETGMGGMGAGSVQPSRVWLRPWSAAVLWRYAAGPRCVGVECVGDHAHPSPSWTNVASSFAARSLYMCACTSAVSARG